MSVNKSVDGLGTDQAILETGSFPGSFLGTGQANMLDLSDRFIGFVSIPFNFVSFIWTFRLLLMAIGLSAGIHPPSAIDTITARIRNTPNRFKTGYLFLEYCAYKAGRS
jgi:hypothetical protein